MAVDHGPCGEEPGRGGASVLRAKDRRVAAANLEAVAELTQRWHAMLRSASDPRADAAAWAIIEVLPAYPAITAAIAGAVTGRAKAAVHNGLNQLAEAGVLVPVAGGLRNRSWEATGLLDLIADLEAGELPR